MSDPNAIDDAALAPWLEAHVEGFAGLKSVTKFSAGQSNPTYRIDAASGSYVLRAKPPGQLLKSAHQVDREFRVMAALARTDVPVPRVFALSGEGEESPIGRMFYVMEFLDGRIFWDPALAELASNEERSGIYDAMNRTLAALHSVDVEAVGLADFGKPGSYFERQLSRWTKQYRASETETLPDMDALIAWLETNAPPDDGRVSLVHGDYRLDNMMFASDRTDVIALRHSGTRLPISPTSACNGACPTIPVSRAWAAWTAMPSACRQRRNMWRAIASGAGWTASPTGISTSPFPSSASPPSCRGSTSARSTATPRTRKRPAFTAPPCPCWQPWR